MDDDGGAGGDDDDYDGEEEDGEEGRQQQQEEAEEHRDEENDATQEDDADGFTDVEIESLFDPEDAARRAGLNNTACLFFKNFVVKHSMSIGFANSVIKFFQSHDANEVKSHLNFLAFPF